MELSLRRFHPNKCWLLITIIKHHYQRERWWQSSHGWLHCMTRPYCLWPATEASLSGVSHNFSQITISIYLNTVDNQASINSQASDQKISRHFHGNSWFATNHGWNKLLSKTSEIIVQPLQIFLYLFFKLVWMLWKPSVNLNYLLKARDIICSPKSRDWGQQYI